ncbi:S-adenosyl-L-methionine-dependent methyltransferase [Ganoderma leucocontextum]|nr:S-adenosyl-L-methionine-dependent methyltransferase [Ganoderma leucocontextum]
MAPVNYNIMTPSGGFIPASLRNVVLPRVSQYLWKKVVSLARSTVCAALEQGITKGRVTIAERAGSYTFGDTDPIVPSRHGYLHVHDETFWVRVYVWYDIGFSEAFLNGEFTSPDLKMVLNIYVDNHLTLDALSTIVYAFNSAVEAVTQRFSHDVLKSVENVAGYDASNELYRAFLSSEMQYSCPLWGEAEGGVRGDLEGHRRPGDLENAQRRKIETILRKARLRSGDRLLEIGSGWGSVAIAAAQMGCTVDTITLSVEQHTLAIERVNEAGVSERVRVHLMDYRSLPPHFHKAFDACISIEMLEAVGVEWMQTYIRTIDWALKDDRAVVVLSATTYPEGTHRSIQGNDFVRKYHWPNCTLPSATSLANAFQDTLHGQFSLEAIEDIGCHYPRCLREWRRRLDENWSETLLHSLQNRYPALKDEKMLSVFRRRWEYMYVYMEVAYSRVWLSLPIWTFVRPGRASLNCA